MAEFNALMGDLRIVPPVEPNALLRPPTQADAWTQNVQAATDWMERERQVSRDQGLWTGGSVFEGGHPTQAGALDAVRQASMNLLLSSSAPGFKAYHGSPHSFDRFDASKIGTGEGAQAYGHGMYFAENEGVARSYRDALAPVALDKRLEDTLRSVISEADTGLSPAMQNTLHSSILRQTKMVPGGADEYLKSLEGVGGMTADHIAKLKAGFDRSVSSPGHMYEVEVKADPEHFLHWDKPLSEQSQYVRDALAKTGIRMGKDPKGSEAWLDVVSHHGLLREGAAAPASTTLREAGIPGIRYLDQGSRGAGEGSHNAVVFDDATIEILRKYGIAGLIAGGGAAAAGSQQPQ